MPPTFRFAPSPNGYLHLGHAYSALLNAAAAQACGGRFLLRIEDIDTTRARPEFEAAIYEDLAWLGLSWEEPVRRQSEHFDDYRCALDRLRDSGLVYHCFCSRGDIAREVARLEAAGAPWPRDPDDAPVYPGTCRQLSAVEAERRFAGGETAAWRLDMAKAVAAAGAPLAFTAVGEDGAEHPVAAEPERWGDVVVARKEVPTSYHLAVVADDALQGVTDVIRGQDLFYATSVHRLLQALLGLPAPRYRHHRLILDDEGRKLSKSLASTALRDLRAEGWTPGEVRARLGFGGAASRRPARRRE